MCTLLLNPIYSVNINAKSLRVIQFVKTLKTDLLTVLEVYEVILNSLHRIVFCNFFFWSEILIGSRPHYAI